MWAGNLHGLGTRGLERYLSLGSAPVVQLGAQG